MTQIQVPWPEAVQLEVARCSILWVVLLTLLPCTALASTCEEVVGRAAARANIALERGRHLLLRDRLEPVPRAPGGLFDLFDAAQTLQRQWRLAAAARSYTAYAAQEEGDAGRLRVARYRATLLHCVLEHVAPCIERAQAFQRLHGANHPRNAGELLLVGAEILDAAGDWSNLLSFLDARMLLWFESSADPDHRAHAFALLGRAQRAVGNQVEALASFQAAEATCDDPGYFIASTAPTPARAVDYLMTTERIAETLFHLAEAEKARVDAVLLPEFTGAPGDNAAVVDYVRLEMGPWAARRTRAIVDATAAYKRVVEITAPVPAWTVRASVQLASMWADLSEQMRDGLPEGTLRERGGWTPALWVTQRRGNCTSPCSASGAQPVW